MYDKEIIVYGADPWGEELYGRIKDRGGDILYFVDDAVARAEFVGKPVHNTFDLLFEDLDGKFIAMAKPFNDNRDRLVRFMAALRLQHGVDYDMMLGREQQIYTVDVNLGHSVIGDLPGFKVFGDWRQRGGGTAKKIVILGGSTSNAYEFSESQVVPWAEHLYHRLSALGDKVVIYCGGISNYTSSQELLKLIRDVVPLKPDIVVSYSGINDAGQYPVPRLHRNRDGRPFLAEETERFYRHATLKCPEGVIPYYKNSVLLGLKNKLGAVEFWLNNMRMMNAIAREFSFLFMGILQPHFGSGNYRRLPEMIRRLGNASLGQGVFEKNYVDFTAKAKAMLRDYPYLLDYSGIFDESGNDVFIDLFRVSSKGNRIVAEHVHEDMLRLRLV
jgi:hypothetical protein